MAKLVFVICALIRFVADGERLEPVAFKKIKAGCSIFDLGMGEEGVHALRLAGREPHVVCAPEN